MLKKIFLTIGLCTGFIFLQAQDIIILQSNDSIVGFVVEVNPYEIKYKKQDTKKDSIYLAARKDVFMIKYENGKRDFITKRETLTPVTSPSSQVSPPAKTTNLAAKKSPGKNCFYLALSIPMGNFSSNKGGGALLGWGFGYIGFSSTNNKMVYFNYQLSYTNHGYDYTIPNLASGTYDASGNYGLWNILGGLAVRGKDPETCGYVNFLVGLNFATVSGILSEAGYSDAFAFEIAPGAGIVAGTIHIGFKYLISKPYFKNNITSGFNVHQEMGIFQLAVGVEF